MIGRVDLSLLRQLLDERQLLVRWWFPLLLLIDEFRARNLAGTHVFGYIGPELLCESLRVRELLVRWWYPAQLLVDKLRARNLVCTHVFGHVRPRLLRESHRVRELLLARPLQVLRRGATRASPAERGAQQRGAQQCRQPREARRRAEERHSRDACRLRRASFVKSSGHSAPAALCCTTSTARRGTVHIWSSSCPKELSAA